MAIYGDDDPESDSDLQGASTAEAIANELVKSYGFGRNSDGSWDWSVDRIAQSFKDEPFWTTLDYVSLAVPVLKWGKAINAVGKAGKAVGVGAAAKEAGVVGEAFRAGEFAGRKAETTAGRIASVFAGDEKAAAAERFLQGPRQSLLAKASPARFQDSVQRFTERFSNSASMKVDQEFRDWADRWGTEAWEGRAYVKSLDRERIISEQASKRFAEETIRDFSRSRGTQEAGVREAVEAGGGTFSADRMLGARMQRAEQMYRQGARPDSAVVQKFFERDPDGMRGYQNRWSYVHKLHEDGFDLGLFSEETYEKGLKNGSMYSPRISQAWSQIRAATRLLDPEAAEVARNIRKATPEALEAKAAEAVTARTRAIAAAEARGEGAGAAKEAGQAAFDAVSTSRNRTPLGPGVKSYAARTKKEEDVFNRILDPRAAMQDMAQASQVVARKRYLMAIANSSMAVKESAMVEHIGKVMASGNDKWMKLWGVSEKKRGAIDIILKNEPIVGREVTGQALGKMFGWKNMEELLGEGKIDGYLESLPDEMRDVWIDPSVASEITGGIQQLSEPKFYEKLYKGIFNTFSFMKVVANPATHVRDFLGSYVDYSKVTGKFPKTVLPARAFKEMWNRTPLFTEAVESGIFGSNYSDEVRDGLRKAFGGDNPDEKLLGQASALDWMGEGGIAKGLQAAAGVAEKTYRGKDDLWKMEAWLTQIDHHTERLMRGGGREALEKEFRLARGGADASAARVVGGSARDQAKAASGAGREAAGFEKFVREKAKESALYDVMRRSTQNAIQSDVSAGLRKVIPFSGFTSEALRTGANTITDKPHVMFFWNHVFETLSEMGGMLGGFSPEELETAKQALPEYQQGKKMVVLPFNIDGQPRFLDVSYLLPLGNVGGMEQGNKLFLRELYDPAANPLLNAVAAAATMKDPFTGRDIEPRFTERQLGVPVTNQGARTIVGLAEHMAAMMLPPLAPPGYAGVNLMEAARGQQNPATGEKLEDGVLTSILRNVAGFRTYTPDVESQVLNVRAEQGRAREQISQSWARYDFAKANGDEGAMEAERERIITLRGQEGDDDPEKYFESSASKREPFSNLTTKQLQEILDRAKRLGQLSPESEQARKLLEERLRKRNK